MDSQPRQPRNAPPRVRRTSVRYDITGAVLFVAWVIHFAGGAAAASHTSEWLKKEMGFPALMWATGVFFVASVALFVLTLVFNLEARLDREHSGVTPPGYRMLVAAAVLAVIVPAAATGWFIATFGPPL